MTSARSPVMAGAPVLAALEIVGARKAGARWIGPDECYRIGRDTLVVGERASDDPMSTLQRGRRRNPSVETVRSLHNEIDPRPPKAEQARRVPMIMSHRNERLSHRPHLQGHSVPK
jgi:hypothetical protein